MDQASFERRIVLALVVLIVLIGGYIAWRVSFSSGVIVESDEARLLDRQGKNIVDLEQQQVQSLMHAGRHQEAAYLLVNLAGMQHILVSVSERKAGIVKGRDTQPSSLELFALFEFTQASQELRAAYLRLLESKYPKWKERTP